ncbi:MAG: hypothetical protein WC619_00280 [Patescibacteria group bacterium]
MKNIFKKSLKFISSRLLYLVIGILLAISATYVYATWDSAKTGGSGQLTEANWNELVTMIQNNLGAGASKGCKMYKFSGANGTQNFVTVVDVPSGAGTLLNLNMDGYSDSLIQITVDGTVYTGQSVASPSNLVLQGNGLGAVTSPATLMIPFKTSLKVEFRMTAVSGARYIYGNYCLQ